MEEQIYTFLINDKFSGESFYFTNISNVSSSKTATITQYTTPSGKRISDHMYTNPVTLSFKLSVSNIAMSPFKKISSSGEVTFLDASEVKSIVENWMNDSRRLSITTFTDKFDNQVLNNIQNSEMDNGIGHWSPTLSFQEVRVAKPQYVSVEFATPIDTEKEIAAETSEQSSGPTAGESIGHTASGALLGAAIGSVIPGVGTAIGAIAGGALGLLGGIFNWWG